MKARIGIFVALLVVAAAAGFWMGGQPSTDLPEPAGAQTAPATPTATANTKPATQPATPDADETVAANTPDAPLYFYAPSLGASDTNAVSTERELAIGAGITNWILPVSLPWPGHEDASNAALESLKTLSNTYPNVRVLLHVNVNPPADWLAAHPDAQVISEGEARPYAAPDAQVFRQDASAALATLAGIVKDADERNQLTGYILSGLEDGYWFFGGDGDRSAAATAAFRGWLTERYRDDAGLQKAWGQDDALLAETTIPERWDDGGTAPVFYSFPEDQNRSDYSRFQSERVADGINYFTRFIKEKVGGETAVLVPYGFTFELPSLVSGHLAMESVLASPIDGIVQPVSLATRVIGNTGGYMGAVNSGLNSRKRWLVLDDTRTGMATAMQEAQGDAMPALRLDSIYNVQRRNFAAAVTNELELAWCDVAGQGQLRDETMWRNFAALRLVYQDVLRSNRANAGQYRIYDLRPEGHTAVMVVVDEESLFLQQAGASVTNRLLRDVRDAALHSGSPVQFCLLSDVLADRAAAADVYVFANTFVLPETDRQRLHAILAREKSVAIWLYAPGYYADSKTPTAKNIAETTLMNVSALKGPATSGSRFDLPGTLLKKDSTFGDGTAWDPLFAIDASEEISPIAYYTDNGDDKISAAAYIPDDGWTSIYLAEPTLTDVLFRELLRILEIPSVFSPSTDTLADTAYFAREIVAVHSKEGGERLLTFPWEYDIVDATQAAKAKLTGAGQDTVTGWLGKRVVDLQMQTGDTRILRITPATPPATQ